MSPAPGSTGRRTAGSAPRGKAGASSGATLLMPTAQRPASVASAVIPQERAMNPPSITRRPTGPLAIVRRHARPLVVVAVVLVAALALMPGTPARVEGGPAGPSEVDAWLDAQLRDAGIVGAAVVVVRDGRIVHERGFGVADDTGRPVGPETPFVLGSVSKSITAHGRPAARRPGPRRPRRAGDALPAGLPARRRTVADRRSRSASCSRTRAGSRPRPGSHRWADRRPPSPGGSPRSGDVVARERARDPLRLLERELPRPGPARRGRVRGAFGAISRPTRVRDRSR